MQLETIRFVDQPGTDSAWSVEQIRLGPFALITGINATGKSRVLTCIAGLGRLIAGSTRITSNGVDCEANWKNGATVYQYQVSFRQSAIAREELTIGGVRRFTRDAQGKGTIFAEAIDGNLAFHIPVHEPIIARRDSAQHSYLEPLHAWADGVRVHHFGTSLNQDGFARTATDKSYTRPEGNSSTTDTHFAFQSGVERIGQEFVTRLVQDMARLDYQVSNIRLATPPSIPVPPEMVAFALDEAGVGVPITQFGMSQGMYRAFALLIRVNCALLADGPHAILIDDIGEGLDIVRSRSLVKLLQEKGNEAARLGKQVQFILSTNDRHVMNAVPLDHVRLLRRRGGHCKVYSVATHPELFRKFRFAGMTNFDLIASDFIETMEGEVGDQSEARSKP